MTLAIVYLVDGFKILVVRLRQIGRGAGQSKWVHGNGRSFANGRFNPPSGDYKSDCEYRDADAEQGAHVSSPLRFQTRCWSRIVPDVIFTPFLHALGIGRMSPRFFFVSFVSAWLTVGPPAIFDLSQTPIAERA